MRRAHLDTPAACDLDELGGAVLQALIELLECHAEITLGDRQIGRDELDQRIERQRLVGGEQQRLGDAREVLVVERRGCGVRQLGVSLCRALGQLLGVRIVRVIHS